MKIALQILVVGLLASGWALALWQRGIVRDTAREHENLAQRLQLLEKSTISVAHQLKELARRRQALTEKINALELAMFESRRQTSDGDTAAGEADGDRGSLAKNVAVVRKELDEIWDLIDQHAQDHQRLEGGALQPPATPPDFSDVVVPFGGATPPRTEEGSNPGAVHWSVDQVLGPPDTIQDGDEVTAWAPREQNAGPEWLIVDFDAGPNPESMLIRETYNPGAVVKVEALDAAGGARTVWEGEDPTRESPGELRVALGNVAAGVQSFRITMDTTKVDGWNELDAVGLVSPAGTRWAVAAEASSTFAEHYEPNGGQAAEFEAGLEP